MKIQKIFENFICKRIRSSANKGMTMVEVLMGFTLLVLMLGMLSGIIASANHIFRNAVDLKNEGEKLQRVVYMKDVTKDSNPEFTNITFVPGDKMPGSHDEIVMQANIFKIGSNSLLSLEDAGETELFVYFIEKINIQNVGDTFE